MEKEEEEGEFEENTLQLHNEREKQMVSLQTIDNDQYKEFEKARRREQLAFARDNNLNWTGNSNAQGPTDDQLAMFNLEKMDRARRSDKPFEERIIVHQPDLLVVNYTSDIPQDQPKNKHLPRTVAHRLIHGREPVTCIHSGCLNLFATSGQDGRVKVWSTRSLDNRPVCTVIAHQHAIRSVTLRERDLVTVSKRQVKVWDLMNKKLSVQFDHKHNVTNAVWLSKDKLLIVSDVNLKLWHVPTKSAIREFTQATSKITCVCAVSDALFVTGHEDYSVRLWNSYDSVPVGQVSKPLVSSVYYHGCLVPRVLDKDQPSFVLKKDQAKQEDNQYEIILSGTKEIAVFQIRNDQIRKRPKALCNGDNAQGGVILKPASDGKYVAVGDAQGQLLIWDLVSGQLAKTVSSEDTVAATGCAIVDGVYMTSGMDGKIKVWE